MPSNELQDFLDEIKDLPDFVAFGETFVEVSTEGLFGNTPLHVAAIRGDVRIIGLLLDAGANIESQGEHGYTPLHEAVEQGHIEAVRLLLQRGASVTATCDDGLTPILAARILKRSEIERLLQTYMT